MQVDLYLASQSPRRQELLQQLGVRFAVRSHAIPEQVRPGEGPQDFVTRLALAKAAAVWDSLDHAERCPVLGSDTVVYIDDRILGKPCSYAEGMAMLQTLSGRTHQVLTGVAVVSGTQSVCVNVSEVTFRKLTAREIEEYWRTGEPQDKAGAYAIQGYAAAFVAHLAGSYSGVMGLPLFETAQLLQKHQVPIWQS